MFNNSGSKRDSRQALRTDGFVYYNQMIFFRQLHVHRLDFNGISDHGISDSGNIPRCLMRTIPGVP